MRAVIDVATIDALSEPQLRELAARLITEVRHKQATIEKLTHEMAVLRRLKFAARSESFTGEHKSLLEEAIDADLEALSREIERERPQPPRAEAKEQPKRQPLPDSLPRREIRHEPEATVCGLRLPTEAHRRGRGREARLHPRRVHRRAAHPRQVGV
jgi:hypothetical protein